MEHPILTSNEAAGNLTWNAACRSTDHERAIRWEDGNVEMGWFDLANRFVREADTPTNAPGCLMTTRLLDVALETLAAGE